MTRISGYVSSCCCSVIVSLVVMATIARCCSEPEGGYQDPAPANMVGDSDLVVMGVTRKVTPDVNFPGSHVYTAEFETRCIFKGEAVEETITIRRVGQVPGLCISTNLTVGVKNIVFLQQLEDGSYEPMYGEWGYGEAYLDEIMGLCEVKMITIQKEVCPVKEADYDDPEFCQMPETPAPNTAGPPMPPTPEAGPNAPDVAMPTEKSSEDSGMNQQDDGTAYNVKDNADPNSASTLNLSMAAVLCLFTTVFVL